VPEAWCIKTLQESVESIEYGYSISIPSEENAYGIPIISTADITKDGSILYSQVRRVNSPKRLTERLLLRDGDVLFNWRNSPELVGKTAIYEEQLQRHVYASFILRIRTTSSFSNSFLCYLLNYYRQIGVFLRLARRAVNQANYNKNEISVLEVPVPPLHVQQEIARTLSSIDRKIEGEENKKRSLEILHNTILSNLMTGKIRVNILEVPV
jgi:type I restriction enzyme S subunit